MDAMQLAALQRMSNTGGTTQQPSPMELSAMQRMADEGSGEQPSRFERLMKVLRDWWHGTSSQEDPEGALQRQQAVDEAVLRSAPGHETLGMDNTLDAVQRRRRLYDEIDQTAR